MVIFSQEMQGELKQDTIPPLQDEDNDYAVTYVQSENASGQP